MTAFEYIRELTRVEGYLELSMLEDALTVLEELPEALKSRPEVVMLRVRILLLVGRRDEAEAFAEDIVAANPASGEALLCLAIAQAQVGKLILARNNLAAAFRLDTSLRLAAESVFRNL